MIIPDLPPDLRFPRLDRDAENMALAFEAKRAALGPHITRRWAWDEDFQRRIHERHFTTKTFFGIWRSERLLGTLSLDRQQDHLRFGEFYLFPAYHGQGTGSAILAHCLMLADSFGLPVRLEYLKWNPVASLYRRHGFQETGRSETHCLLQRKPGGNQGLLG